MNSRHVYLATQLAFDGATCDSAHYDDGNRLLLVATGRSLFRHSVSDPGVPVTVTDIGGGPVLGARFSLDCRVLAVQRSDTDIEFYVADRPPFQQRCRRAPVEKVLTFFWAASAGVDFVLATTGGLELYELLPQAQGLRLVEDKRKPGVAWATYSHETRLAVLGCGPQGSRLFGFQFTGTGRIKLPKFELPPSAQNTQHTDVRLLAVYGRLFCAHVDAEKCTLVLYRFYRDALLRQHSFPIPSARVALAIVDNTLVIFTLDTGRALILDVLSGSVQPLSLPLPLGLLDALPDGTTEVPLGDVLFFAPDLAVHRAYGRVWRLRLDLAAFAGPATDRVALVGFLQRRREPFVRAPLGSAPLGSALPIRAPQGPKALSLDAVRTMIKVRTRDPVSPSKRQLTHLWEQERHALSDIGRVFDTMCTSLASCGQAGGSASGGAGGASALQNNDWSAAAPIIVPPGSPTIACEELHTEVLNPLRDSGGVDEAYWRAVVMEYLRAADASGLQTPATLLSAAVESLTREHCVHQLPMWRPLLMPPLAARGQPLAMAAAHSVGAAVAGSTDDGAVAFAKDVTQRCMPHDAIVREMLATGEVLAALRYVRRHRVESLLPAVFMEAAAKSGRSRLFHSAFYFCSAHVPGFSALPEYSEWKSRLG